MVHRSTAAPSSTPIIASREPSRAASPARAPAPDVQPVICFFDGLDVGGRSAERAPSTGAPVSPTAIGRGARSDGARPSLWDDIREPGILVGDGLREVLATRAAEASYISESDSTAVAFVVPNPRSLALNAEAIAELLPEALAELAAATSSNVADLAVVELSPEDAADHLQHIGAPESGDSPEYLAMRQAFQMVLLVMRRTLVTEPGRDIQVFKAGLRDPDAGGLAVDRGAYTYFLAAKAHDGDLAGVRYNSVET